MNIQTKNLARKERIVKFKQNLQRTLRASVLSPNKNRDGKYMGLRREGMFSPPKGKQVCLSGQTLPSLSKRSDACRKKTKNQIRNMKIDSVQFKESRAQRRFFSPNRAVRNLKHTELECQQTFNTSHHRRVFSAERQAKPVHLLTDKEVRKCEDIHLKLIEKSCMLVSNTRMARFKGFLSPQKLTRKLLNTSTQNPHMEQRIIINKPVVAPRSCKEVIKFNFLDPISSESTRDQSELDDTYLGKNFYQKVKQIPFKNVQDHTLI